MMDDVLYEREFVAKGEKLPVADHSRDSEKHVSFWLFFLNRIKAFFKPKK